MAASYPSATKSFTTKANNDTIDASHVDDLQDEVTAIENGLRTGLAHDLAPDATANNRDLGTSASKWRNAYINGTADMAAAKIAGDTALVDNSVCSGRLTLTTVVPVTSADVTAATTVYFTPYRGNKIALYDGSANWVVRSFSELSIALGADAANTNYDVFAYDNSGTVAIERLAWTNDTTRATALALQNGVYVKSGATTRRYLGTYRTAAIGQTEDSLAKRFVWNYYNRVSRAMRVTEATDSWTYNTATIRQANASTANQLAFVIGVAEVEVAASVRVNARNANDTYASVGIGEDSTTVYTTGFIGGTVELYGTGNRYSPVSAELRRYPAVGYHYWAWLEIVGAVASNTTFTGDEGVPTRTQAGIHGTVQG